MTRFHLLAFSAAALALGACDKGADNAAAPSGSVQSVAAPAGQDWQSTVTRTADGFLMGNPNAPIKLVEYGSRTCPHCAKFDEEGVPPLRDKYVSTGKVSYEFRDYPVHGPLDVPAIVLGRCGDPSTYFPILDQMMRNQEAFLAKTSALDQAKLNALQNDPVRLSSTLAEDLGYLDFVKQRGIPESKARACLADRAQLDALVKTTNEANTQYNITGTPTFVLNGKVLEGAGEWPKVEEALKNAGA